MGLKKGMTNNPNGRSVGAVNKVTTDLRKRINTLLEDNWKDMEDSFKALEGKDKLQFYLKLLEYTLPKLQSAVIIPEEPKVGIFDAIEKMRQSNIAVRQSNMDLLAFKQQESAKLKVD